MTEENGYVNVSENRSGSESEPSVEVLRNVPVIRVDSRAHYYRSKHGDGSRSSGMLHLPAASRPKNEKQKERGIMCSTPLVENVRQDLLLERHFGTVWNIKDTLSEALFPRGASTPSSSLAVHPTPLMTSTPLAAHPTPLMTSTPSSSLAVHPTPLMTSTPSSSLVLLPTPILTSTPIDSETAPGHYESRDPTKKSHFSMELTKENQVAINKSGEGTTSNLPSFDRDNSLMPSTSEDHFSGQISKKYNVRFTPIRNLSREKRGRSKGDGRGGGGRGGGDVKRGGTKDGRGGRGRGRGDVKDIRGGEGEGASRGGECSQDLKATTWKKYFSRKKGTAKDSISGGGSGNGGGRGGECLYNPKQRTLHGKATTRKGKISRETNKSSTEGTEPQHEGGGDVGEKGMRGWCIPRRGGDQEVVEEERVIKTDQSRGKENCILEETAEDESTLMRKLLDFDEIGFQASACLSEMLTQTLSPPSPSLPPTLRSAQADHGQMKPSHMKYRSDPLTLALPSHCQDKNIVSSTTKYGHGCGHQHHPNKEVPVDILTKLHTLPK